MDKSAHFTDGSSIPLKSSSSIPSSSPPRSGLLALSLGVSGVGFLGLEVYELLLWMLVKGRPVDIIHAQKIVTGWMALIALAAVAFGGLAWRRHAGDIRAAMDALGARGRGVWRVAIFTWLVVQANVLYEPLNFTMTLFRTMQGLTAFWFSISLTVWLYRRLAPRPELAPMPHPLVNRLWAGLLPLFIFALGYVFMRGVWGRIPHIIDETSYIFQAWTFAQGRTWLPLPPMGEFFEVEFLGQLDGKWFGYYPPGWPAVLAPFVALKIEVLANPLLGAVAMYLLVQLLKEERLDPWFWVVVPLLAMSPEVLMESGTFMNENLVLIGNLAAVLMLLRAGDRRGRRRRLVIAGVAAGVVFSTRYLDGLCLMALAMALLAQTPGMRMGERLRAATLIIAPFALIVAANLAYNRSITGAWLLTPFKYYTDFAYGPDYTRLGFGPGIGKHLEASLAPGHSLIEAIYNAQINVQTLSRTLWGWIAGSLAPVFLFLAFGRKTLRDWTYLGFAASYFIVYALWWYHGVGLGARYYYPLIFIWVIWTLKAARWFAEEALPKIVARVRGGGVGEWDPRQARLAIVAFILVNQAMALLFTWPVLGAFFFNFLGVTREVEDAIVAKGIPPCVVFINENDKPPIYQYYFLLNHPRAVEDAAPPAGMPQAGPVWFDSPVVFLRDRGVEENLKWREYFPERPLYVYRGGRLEIVADPPDN